MLKNISQLEFVVGEKSGRLLFDMDTPIQIVKEILFQAQKYVGQVEDQVKAQYDAQMAEQKAKEEAEMPKTDLPVTDEVKD
jgi:hypothetical protein